MMELKDGWEENAWGLICGWMLSHALPLLVGYHYLFNSWNDLERPSPSPRRPTKHSKDAYKVKNHAEIFPAQRNRMYLGRHLTKR